MIRRNLPLTLILLCFAAACDTSTGGAPVTVALRVAPREADARPFQTADGWTVQVDEAVVLVGPLYLRAPKRDASALARLFVSRAHAHGGHAQTLKEGRVIAEYLGQQTVDAFAPGTAQVALVGEAGPVATLSLMLEAPREPTARARSYGHVALVQGVAMRGDRRVTFSCGLDISSDPDDTPENLEARRRIDQIPLTGSGSLDEGATLTLSPHPERWLEFVSFDDFASDAVDCTAKGSALALQLYLGLRRPEAFGAHLEGGRP